MFLLIRPPRVNVLHIFVAWCFTHRSNEDGASCHDESGSYLSNLNGPARRAKDGGNTKQGINRVGFAR